MENNAGTTGRMVGAVAGAGVSFVVVTILAVITFALGVVVSLFGLLAGWHTAVVIIAVTILVIVLEYVLGAIVGIVLGRKVAAPEDVTTPTETAVPRDHSAGIYPPHTNL